MQSVGLSSITVKWEAVPFDGILKGYQVRYRQIFSNGSDGEIKTLFQEGSATNATLIGLEKASTYRIEVAAETFSGIGNYSEPVVAMTCKFKTVIFQN